MKTKSYVIERELLARAIGIIPMILITLGKLLSISDCSAQSAFLLQILLIFQKKPSYSASPLPLESPSQDKSVSDRVGALKTVVVSPLTPPITTRRHSSPGLSKCCS